MPRPRYLDIDLAPYAGQYVALVEGRIIAIGDTAAAATSRARIARSQRAATILHISSPMPPSPLASQPAAAQAHATLLALAPDAILVGGAVRDLLLGVAIHDLDYVLASDALRVARDLANHLGAAYYPLDAERGVGRVIWKQPSGEPLVIDLTTFRGAAIDDDLRARDFTLNAITLLPTGAYHDPLGGITDLRERHLRLCRANSLRTDPIRILRAARFLFTFRLHPAPELDALVRDAAPDLSAVSPERQRDELFKLLALPEPHLPLTQLDAWDVLLLLIPDLAALHNIEQPPPHVYDVYEHTLVALRWQARLDRLIRQILTPTDEIEVAILAVFAPFQANLQTYLDHELSAGRPRWLWLRLAALTHDWGKAATRSQDADDRTRFFGHEDISAHLANAWLQQLHCAGAEIAFIDDLCRGHMRPLHLGRQPQPPSRRSLYRLFRDLGDATPALLLLHLADHLATYGPDIEPHHLRDHLNFVASLLKLAFPSHPDAAPIVPKPLLDGHDIMKLVDLKPGPQVGHLLEQLREAQATGEISDQSQAIAFIQRHPI